MSENGVANETAVRHTPRAKRLTPCYFDARIVNENSPRMAWPSCDDVFQVTWYAPARSAPLMSAITAVPSAASLLGAASSTLAALASVIEIIVTAISGFSVNQSVIAVGALVRTESLAGSERFSARCINAGDVALGAAALTVKAASESASDRNAVRDD